MSRANISLVLVALFLVLFSLTFTSAQQGQPFQQSEQETGFLIIETGFPTSHKMNEDYYIHAHVYNGTNGLLVTSGIDCNYHFYNHQIKGGEHIDIGILTQYGSGYYNNTDGSLLNETGEYSVLIWCNSTTEGGFTKYAFDVTPTGLTIQDGTSGIYIAMLFVLIIFLILSLLSFAQFDNLLNGVGMIGLSYLLLIAISFISWNMANDFLYSAPFIISMFRIFFYVLMVGLFPLLIGGFVWYLLMLWKIKEIQDLMKKGMPYDEAEHRVKRRKR